MQTAQNVTTLGLMTEIVAFQENTLCLQVLAKIHARATTLQIVVVFASLVLNTEQRAVILGLMTVIRVFLEKF